MTWFDHKPYSWRQGYKAFNDRANKVMGPGPHSLNPYDQDTQPLNYGHWLDGWHYAEDEHGN